MNEKLRQIDKLLYEMYKSHEADDNLYFDIMRAYSVMKKKDSTWWLDKQECSIDELVGLVKPEVDESLRKTREEVQKSYDEFCETFGVLRLCKHSLYIRAASAPALRPRRPSVLRVTAMQPM